MNGIIESSRFDDSNESSYGMELNRVLTTDEKFTKLNVEDYIQIRSIWMESFLDEWNMVMNRYV